VSDPAAAPAVRVDWRALTLVGLLAFAASAPSLANGFAYDDQWIIVTNARVHDLGRWADWFTTSYWPTREATLYRPLTTAAFALQWAVGGGTALVFHVVNVALAVAGAVAFTWLASLVLPATAAIVVGAVFAVHPVHVEAVGNVVGQSELSAGLALILALAVYVRARRAGPLRRATALGLAAAYLTAVLLKEHALMLPAWFVAAEFTVLRDLGPWRARVRDVASLFVMLGAVAAFSLVVRWDVLGAIGGDIPHPALNGLTAMGRAFVMLDVLPEIARLLLWPARLYADYSPEHIRVSPDATFSHLNGALIAAGAITLFAVGVRRSAPVALGLLLAALAWLPTANLLMPSGILLAERALYMSSAGVLLAAGAGVAWLDRRFSAGAGSAVGARRAAGAVIGLLLTLGMVRSIDRQRAWRSSDEVFWTLVNDAPASFKAHHAWGGVLFERGDLRGGERELLMAIRIFPAYHKLYQDLAAQYRQGRQCHAAIPLYKRALELGGPLPLSRAGLVACELVLARFREARRTAMLGIADGHDPAWFRARLRSADSALAAHDSL
jgi:hypothetical protein